MTDQQDSFTADDAREIGESIGIDWGSSPFDVEQFRAGLHVELEHGRRDPETNVTDDDLRCLSRSYWGQIGSNADGALGVPAAGCVHATDRLFPSPGAGSSR